MGAFTYVDIFLTKGIEYLLVIDFLLVFILFWMALTTPAEEAQKVMGAGHENMPEDIPRDKEARLFGPQWAWKWEIIRV